MDSSGGSTDLRAACQLEGLGMHRCVACLLVVTLWLTLGAANALAVPFVRSAQIPALGESKCGYKLDALSGDGNTAILGNLCNDHKVGAAWIYVKSGASWVEQAELHPTDEVGDAEFGEDVALSYNGDTAIVGGENDNGGAGAAWVFQRSGGTWTQAAPKFSGQAEERCGVSVAISADGNRAIMSCKEHGVDIFVHTGGNWFQEGPEIPIPAGNAIALSGDGNTALLGDHTDANILVRGESGWTEQASIPIGNILRGGAAISEDGNTALAGGTVLVRSGSTWSVQQQLSTYQQGEALSANGDEALLGTEEEEGASATLFVRSGSSWTKAETLLHTQEPAFVALSANGDTALVSEGETEGWSVFTREVAPTVITGPATSITRSTATLEATVNPNGDEVTSCKLEYGETTSYDASVPCSPAPGEGSSPVAVSAAIADLAANTTYHYRVVASNAGGISEGADATFTTLVAPPTIVVQSPSAVGQRSLTLNATVNPNGGAVNSCKFEYGLTEGYGAKASCTPSPNEGDAPVAVGASLSGLGPGTTYHYRLVATNAGGTTTTSDQTAQTALPELPEVGRCLPAAMGKGRYTSKTCTTKSTGENTGAYEWQPWPAAKDRFSFKNGGATLETAHRSVVACTTNTLEGEYSGSQAANARIIFTGCEAPGALGGKCQSSGAGIGEIATDALKGWLGFITSGSAGWDYAPASGATVATFVCGTTEITLAGSVIAPVKPVNKMVGAFSLKLKGKKGRQSPERLEGAPQDVLRFITSSGEEQAGLTAADALSGEEAIEVKAAP